MFFNISPVAKPRMTRSDTWKKRDIVMNYRNYKDTLRLLARGWVLPETFEVTFGIQIPKGFTNKKKELLIGTGHKQRPDIDNLLKGLMDALLEEDSHVWNVKAKKIWAREGFIEIQ